MTVIVKLRITFTMLMVQNTCTMSILSVQIGSGKNFSYTRTLANLSRPSSKYHFFKTSFNPFTINEWNNPNVIIRNLGNYGLFKNYTLHFRPSANIGYNCDIVRFT